MPRLPRQYGTGNHGTKQMIRRYGEQVKQGQRYKRRPGVYAILLDGDEMLATHQAEPVPEYQLPGGGIDAGEHPVAALHREVLRLSSDKPLAFIVARLCDVAPDGSATRIAHGILNLCHRRSREAPEPMLPGVPEDIQLVLDQMGYQVAAGHRLRLALSMGAASFA